MYIMVNQTIVSLVQGDITEQDTEAVVNAANSTLLGGSGVDGAIHRVGGPQILAECKKIRVTQGECPTGEAVLTSGGNLPAKYVIHTVGPVWRGGGRNEPQLLKNCYLNSLKLARANGIRSVSFPSVSTGAYSYPTEEAARIALGAIIEFVTGDSCFEEIRMVLFSAGDYETYRAALSERGF